MEQDSLHSQSINIRTILTISECFYFGAECQERIILNTYSYAEIIPDTKNDKRKQGVCIDTGTRTTLIELKQSEAYCRFVGAKFKLEGSNNSYSFGGDRQHSFGSINIRIPILSNVIISERIDGMKAKFLFLLGLELLGK